MSAEFWIAIYCLIAAGLVIPITLVLLRSSDFGASDPEHPAADEVALAAVFSLVCIAPFWPLALIIAGIVAYIRRGGENE